MTERVVIIGIIVPRRQQHPKLGKPRLRITKPRGPNRQQRGGVEPLHRPAQRAILIRFVLATPPQEQVAASSQGPQANRAKRLGLKVDARRPDIQVDWEVEIPHAYLTPTTPSAAPTPAPRSRVPSSLIPSLNPLLATILASPRPLCGPGGSGVRRTRAQHWLDSRAANAATEDRKQVARSPPAI